MRRLVLIVGLIASTSVQPLSAAQSREAVKTAMIYNILRFVEFSGGGSSLRVCALSGDSLSGKLKSLSGRTIGGRKIEVVLLRSPSDFGSSCRAIYTESLHANDFGGVRSDQVLIGERSGFAERGGTVGLISFGGQVRFEINERTAHRAGVKLSSQLMQLAARVY